MRASRRIIDLYGGSASNARNGKLRLRSDQPGGDPFALVGACKEPNPVMIVRAATRMTAEVGHLGRLRPLQVSCGWVARRAPTRQNLLDAGVGGSVQASGQVTQQISSVHAALDARPK
jgi:hypothetical protein